MYSILENVGNIIEGICLDIFTKPLLDRIF